MKSVASAPGKIILFGEHFVVYGVKAILCSIDKRITVSSKIIGEKKIKIKSDVGSIELSNELALSPNESVSKLLKPIVHIAKKTMEKYKKDVGIEVDIESEIPPGIGLGSSSACCVAASASISRLFEKISKEEILKMAIEAERTIFKKSSGADCSVCAFGGLIQYDVKNGFKKIASNADFELVIVNSKETHHTSEVVDRVHKFKKDNEKLFSSLCDKESSIIQDALRSLEKNDVMALGMLMNENQKLLEQIGVSTQKLDVLVNEVKKTSFGVKITGAGGGGCIISLVDKSNLNKTLTNLRKYGDCFSTRIDYTGLI